MKNALYSLLGLLVLASIVWIIVTPPRVRVGKLDDFAKCIKDSGATFYGAFWCPHCQNQKKEFGTSAQYLPYVECSTADGQGQLQVCKDAGVSIYPTWQFGQSTTTRLTGEISLEQLASSTSCILTK